MRRVIIISFILLLSACSMRPSWETAKLREGRTLASYDDGYYSQKGIENIVKEIPNDKPIGKWRFSARAYKDNYSYTVNNDNLVDSFRIVNTGFNDIITKNKLVKSATRTYEMKYADRKRQDIHLHISDVLNDHTEKRTEVLIYFFPRKYYPAIEALDNDMRIVLPTGEKVYFDATKKIIEAGPMEEEHVDYNLVPNKRSFPRVKYTGFGLTVTVERRMGIDPRKENVAVIKHPDVKEECLVASNDLFKQQGRYEFKFTSDSKFEEYLVEQCDFSLPQPGVFIP